MWELFFLCSLARYVALFFAGGLAVGKFFNVCALFLVVMIFSQHLQVERERDNWRKFRVEMDLMSANAAVPAAGVAAANPYVLAALVLGTGAYWCWTHGGKEAWMQFTKATKDGVEITKDWVQKKIAEINGINVDGLDGVSLDGMFVNLSGKKYRILQPFELNYATSSPELNAEIQGWSYTSGGEGIIYHTIGFKKGSFERDGVLYNVFDIYNVSYVGSSGFDPADYPALYSGPAFLINCHAVAKANPDIKLYAAPVTGRPAIADAFYSIFPFAVSSLASIVFPNAFTGYKALALVAPVVAQMQDGSLVNDKGGKMPPPPPGVVPNLINPPLVDSSAVATVSVAKPKENELYPPVALPVVLPKPVSEQLHTYVPPSGAVQGLTNIGANNPAVRWVNAQGQEMVTPIPQALASQLAGTLPAIGAVTGAVSTPESPGADSGDPGDPADIPLPDIPVFDSEINWGEEKPWPWEKWIGSLPFVDVLKSSSINLSGSTSVVSFEFSIFGKSKLISYDFSQWHGLLNSMGLIIYACACWYALQLALLKRD